MEKHVEPSLVMSRGQQENAVRRFLSVVQEEGCAEDNLLGLLHVLIGRTITTVDGEVISSGYTYRNLAALLKKLRWDREEVNQLGLIQGDLPPRDRQRFWYTAICQANVDSADAIKAGDRLAKRVEKAGYVIGPSPSN